MSSGYKLRNIQKCIAFMKCFEADNVLEIVEKRMMDVVLKSRDQNVSFDIRENQIASCVVIDE